MCATVDSQSLEYLGYMTLTQVTVMYVWIHLFRQSFDVECKWGNREAAFYTKVWLSQFYRVSHIIMSQVMSTKFSMLLKHIYIIKFF